MELKDKAFEEWTYDKFEHVAKLLVGISKQLQALSDLDQMQQDQIIDLKKRIIALENRSHLP